jgi:hypothetical protein
VPQYKVMFATFPYGDWLHPDVCRWLTRVMPAARQDARVSGVVDMAVADTPITMSRNKVLKEARRLGVDYVLMVDSDMSPDLPYPDARPFWDTAFDFAVSRREEVVVVAAPYCGPPPYENMYVFQWGRRESDSPNVDLHLDQYSREEAARMAGVHPAGALPTGLCLIDTRVTDLVPPPWFKYEYADPPYDSEKAGTEDVVFTRNVTLHGGKVYCNWDAWAGHNKAKCVGKPQLLTSEAVAREFKEAVLKNRSHREKMVYVQPDPAPRGLRNGDLYVPGGEDPTPMAVVRQEGGRPPGFDADGVEWVDTRLPENRPRYVGKVSQGRVSGMVEG